MQTIDDTLALLRRQAEIEAAMKTPTGIRIIQEQELHVIRRQLQQFPAAVQAILQAAHALRKSMTDLSATNVETWVSNDKVA
jgi:hypothetical protein